jgi:hypothetical protein
MSLFENDAYQWRETFFIYFNPSNRPAGQVVELALKQLGPNYELVDLNVDADGNFESLTLISNDDYAAMDITFLQGGEVTDGRQTVVDELEASIEEDDEREKLSRLKVCDARLDVFHFEQVVYGDPDDEEEFLDPGSLLIVLERLTDICRGVGFDPQSGALL